MFPWMRSGFRYQEARALLELAPDTRFFSLWELTDPFPAPVQPLAQFPRIAARDEITDAYGVFQLFLAGLVGMRPSGEGPPHPMEGPNMSAFLRRSGVRLHGMIYPGGGLTETTEGIAQAAALTRRLTTTFSYLPEVLENVEGVTAVDKAMTDTRFYSRSDARWAQTDKVVCLFAADAPPRKGVDVALKAFAGLPADDFHLHVVGPHEHRAAELPRELATFHGWLSPEQLRDLHRQTHIFISPVSAEPPGPAGTLTGVTDGFPTQTASDAMSSGCLLVSANPRADDSVLHAGAHYLECEADARRLRECLSALTRDWARMRGIAQAGSAQVRSRMDIRHGVAAKLAHMGIR